MKPLNKKQRSAAIVKFILVYIFALAILAVPVFAIFEIPDKQCDINENVLSRLETNLDKCREEKRALSGQSAISSSMKGSLTRIYNDYVEYTNVLDIGVTTLDDLIADDNAKFDEKRIQQIEEADIKIFDTKKKISAVNESFGKLLKDLD